MTTIRWATFLVAALTILALGLLAVWGRRVGLSEDAHAGVLAFLGTIGSVVLAYMRSVFSTGDPLGLKGDPKGSKDEE